VRIINREEFLSMPSGTIYRQASHPFAWSDMAIKNETHEPCEGFIGDWSYIPLDWIECSGSSQLFERMDEMKDNGGSYPLDLDTTMRDGLYEKGRDVPRLRA